jgi:hypothetical protein
MDICRVPYARTLNNNSITGRFSDLHPPKEPFPLILSSGTASFGLLIQSGTNAYSGATVTAFHRVPYSAINISFQKNKQKIPSPKNQCNRKIKKIISAAKLQQASP